MNGMVSFLPTLRTCMVMFIRMKALSVIQIKVYVALLKLLRQKPLLLLEKKVQYI